MHLQILPFSYKLKLSRLNFARKICQAGSYGLYTLINQTNDLLELIARGVIVDLEFCHGFIHIFSIHVPAQVLEQAHGWFEENNDPTRPQYFGHVVQETGVVIDAEIDDSCMNNVKGICVVLESKVNVVLLEPEEDSGRVSKVQRGSGYK